MSDQPAVKPVPTREHRRLAASLRYGFGEWVDDGPMAHWIEDGHIRAVAREVIPIAQFLADLSATHASELVAAAEERAVAEREGVIDLLLFKLPGASRKELAQAIARGEHLKESK